MGKRQNREKSAVCPSLTFLSLKRLSTGPVEALPAHRGRRVVRTKGTDSVCWQSQELVSAFPQVMVPSLDDIQQAINRMIQLTLEVSRGVAHWGQQQTHYMKPAATSSSRTTTDQSHTSAGKQLKKEESKTLSQISHP